MRLVRDSKIKRNNPKCHSDFLGKNLIFSISIEEENEKKTQNFAPLRFKKNTKMGHASSLHQDKYIYKKNLYLKEISYLFDYY